MRRLFSKPENHGRTPGDFLPNLCTVQAVFHLVLVGELLAIALTLVQTGIKGFDSSILGAISMFVLWIVLGSAALLCPLRPLLRRLPLAYAGALSFTTVMLVSTLLAAAAGFLSMTTMGFDWDRFWTILSLAAVFAGIVLRYFYLQQQLRNQQQAELTARIQALQARIRPHFLFNSMNSIATLIDFDPPRAERMVLDLADLFRASLQEPGLTPLQQEIELCQRYASIETVRIGDRLRVNWRIDAPPEVLVPSLLLQPLLENAIYHGVEPLPQGGTIDVCASVEGDLLCLVIDNPVATGGQLSSRGNGLALNNIRHRLSAYYGTAGALKVTATDGRYRVEVSLPARLTDD